MKKYVGVEDGKIIWNDQTGEPVCTVDEAEQRRRAELFDPLVEALKAALRTYRQVRPQIFGTDAHEEYLRAILARCAKKEG